jgi:hypothetical protein
MWGSTTEEVTLSSLLYTCHGVNVMVSFRFDVEIPRSRATNIYEIGYKKLINFYYNFSICS